MFVMIVLVVALPSIDASTKLTSAEVCQQIRTNQLSILTMGSRGHPNPHQHRFYLLTSLGYLFVVPFANLKVDLQTKRTRLIIDTDYKDASQLYNEPSAIFTTKPGNGAHQRFYLITVDQFEHKFYLLREYGNSINTCYYYYSINTSAKYSEFGDCVDGGDEYELFAMNVETSEYFKKSIVAYYCVKDYSRPNKIWKYDDMLITDISNTKDLSDAPKHYLETLVFPLKSPILISFYVGVNGFNYTVLLFDNGRVIVGENEFEVSLSDFIECFPSKPSDTMAQFPWFWAKASVVLCASVAVHSIT